VPTHPLAERSLAENERVWSALSAEFEAAKDELLGCMRFIDGKESDSDHAAFERARRRLLNVESAMATFLDALDG